MIQTPHAKPSVVGLGELLWDCFGSTRKPGGAPSNVAYHARQWGLDACVCSRVGNDPDGKELLDFLTAKDICTQGIQIDETHPTSTVTVEMNPDNTPRYVIHEEVAWDNMKFTDTWEQLAVSADAVSFGSLAQRSDNSRKAIWDFLEFVSLKCLVVFDVNLRQHYYYKKWLDQSMNYAWIVKISEEESATFADEMGLCTHEPCKLYADQLRSIFGVPVTCFTRGKNGCLLCTEDDVVDVPGYAIPSESLSPNSDTVGAGDAFTAAMIYGFLNEFPVDKIAVMANMAGAFVASQAGAMPEAGKRYADILCELGLSPKSFGSDD